MLIWTQSRKRQLDYEQPWINGTNPEDDQGILRNFEVYYYIEYYNIHSFISNTVIAVMTD